MTAILLKHVTKDAQKNDRFVWRMAENTRHGKEIPGLSQAKLIEEQV